MGWLLLNEEQLKQLHFVEVIGFIHLTEGTVIPLHLLTQISYAV